MQTQTTGTATMTETAGAADTPWDHEQARSTVMARIEAGTVTAAGKRLIVNPTTGTLSFDDRAGAEFRAREEECDRRRGVYEHRDALARGGMTWAEAQAACAGRLAGVAAEYEAAMGRIAAKYDVTPTPRDRYLARLDAAVKVAPPVREGDPCPLCGARQVQREYERGLRSWWLCCEDILCGWQERDPDQRGLLLDVRA